MKELKDDKNSGNELLEFFIGVLLLGLGLFMLFKKAATNSDLFEWSAFGTDLTTGLIILPFIIGIIWHFYNSKSILPKILTALGIAIIVATIIISVNITLDTMALWDYILIVGMSATGAVLLIKTLIMKHKENR